MRRWRPYTCQEMKRATTHYLIAYDISSDRRRTKIAEILDDYGARRQLSVFEVNVSGESYAEMRKRILSIADADRDEITSWTICSDCISKRDYISVPEGKREEEIDPDIAVF